MVKSNSSRSTEKSSELKKGAWSAEEDRKLINYIKRYKIWNWSEMSKAAGLKRSGKSCRLRWVNYLRPDIKHGNFSSEEVETIMALHETLGNRWATIATRLPGRTDNEVKNFWHTHLKKRLNKSNPSTSTSTSSVILVHDDDEISPKPMSESELVLFSPEPEEEIIAPKFAVIESSQPMSTDDFSSPPLLSINSENISNNHDRQQDLIQNNNISDQSSITNTTTSTFEILGQPQNSWTQQEPQMVGELFDPGHGLLMSSFFEPDSLVGPSTNELMWQHESTWTYENFCEDVSNDWLDYMDPIF